MLSLHLQSRALRQDDIERLRRMWDEGKASGAARAVDFRNARREIARRLAKARKPSRIAD